jgi:hypothetical protein
MTPRRVLQCETAFRCAAAAALLPLRAGGDDGMDATAEPKGGGA